MSKLFDYTVEILVATVAIFFLWGVGHMMMKDLQNGDEFKTQCIATGMQYVNGSCVK